MDEQTSSDALARLDALSAEHGRLSQRFVDDERAEDEKAAWTDLRDGCLMFVLYEAQTLKTALEAALSRERATERERKAFERLCGALGLAVGIVPESVLPDDLAEAVDRVLAKWAADVAAPVGEQEAPLPKTAKRKEIEEAAAARKHVMQRGQIGFTYKPTPPSGPAPPDGTEADERTEET